MKLFRYLFFCLLGIIQNSWHPAQAQQTPSEPRMLLNPGSAQTWDSVNSDNDFMLDRNPIISAILSSALTPSTTTSTSVSSSVSSSKSESTSKITTSLEQLENELFDMITEDEEKLETFILNKVTEFESRLLSVSDGNSSLTRKMNELQVAMETLQNVVKEKQTIVFQNTDIPDIPNFDLDQAKAALDLADHIDSLIASLDRYNWITPTLNKIQAFSNSRKELNYDTKMERRSFEEDQECGGVMIGETGEISYTGQGSGCIWTLRVLGREQILLDLELANVSQASDLRLSIHSLTLSPSTLLFGLVSFKGAGNVGIGRPVILSPTQPTIVTGPIIFITLPSGRQLPSFRLSYRATGPKITPDPTTPTKYRHYSHTSRDGVIDYPFQDPGQNPRKYYGGPEIVTFTLSPEPSVPFRIFLEELDIPETHFFGGCSQDSITFFGAKSHKYLPLVGNKTAAKGRASYCGVSEDISGDEISSQGPTIVVFKSDPFLSGAGFRFSWESE